MDRIACPGRIRTAVLVSGGGTNLQALIDAGAEGRLPHVEFAAVISGNPEAYALTRARQAGIPAYSVCRRDCATQTEFESGIRGILDDCGAELIILAGFLSILSADFTSAYPDRIINIHPSLIPSFCGKGFYGLRVHEAALEYGVKVTGATAHFVNEIPDGGRIILQKAVYVQPGDTPQTLQQRVMREAEWQILPQAAELVAKELCERRSAKQVLK